MSFMKRLIVSTLVICRVVSFMFIFTDGKVTIVCFSLSLFLLSSASSQAYVNAVLLFLIIIEMKS